MKIDEDGSIRLSDDEQTEKAAYIAGLREFANWLESKPIGRPHSDGRILFCSQSKKEFFAIRRACAIAEKDLHGDYVHFVKRFSGDVSFVLFAEKSLTCERVKVGTKIVPAKPQVTLPAEPEREEEVWEWQCPDSILQSAH